MEIPAVPHPGGDAAADEDVVLRGGETAGAAHEGPADAPRPDR